MKNYNCQRKHGEPEIIDPSTELIAVTNTFLSWYKLYRPKTLDDVATLQQLSQVTIIVIIEIIVIIVIFEIILIN